MVGRHRCPNLGRHHRRAAGRRRARRRITRRHRPKGAVPRPRRPRNRGSVASLRNRAAAGRTHPRITDPRGRRRPRADGARSGADQHDDPRVRRHGDHAGAAALAVDPRTATAPPRTVPVVADRARPRPPRRRDSRSRASTRQTVGFSNRSRRSSTRGHRSRAGFSSCSSSPPITRPTPGWRGRWRSPPNMAVPFSRHGPETNRPRIPALFLPRAARASTSRQHWRLGDQLWLTLAPTNKLVETRNRQQRLNVCSADLTAA